MGIQITGMFEPSGGAGAFDLYDPADMAAGDIDVLLTLIAGGKLTSNGTAGEIIIQTGTGVPSHSASEGVLYWNTNSNVLYCNNNGSTGWTAIGTGSGAVATDTIWDAAGDLAVGTGADTAAKLTLTVPAANVLNVLGVVNGETTPTWKAAHDATNPAPIGTAAPGTSVITAHRDHVHAAAASAVSVDSTTLVGVGTDVQAVLEELDNGIADHLADATDAHDASSISILDTAADFTATDVEGALAELQSDNEAHVAAADPHTGYRLESADHSHASSGAEGGNIAASSVTIADAGADFTATTVEGALDELQADNEAHVAAADPHTGYVREADANWVDLTDGGATTLHSHAGGGGAHTLLDASSHTDTAADTVSRGSIIIGNSTPAWDELVVGAANTVLKSDGTDPTWAQPFIWMPIAEWFVGGPMRTDSSNHLSKVVKIPDYATAVAGLVLVCNLVTAPTGSAANFDIKYSTTFGGATTSLFSTTPTIAAAANEDSAAVFSPTTIDGAKYLRLYCTQKGSTEAGRDLTVQIWGKVYVEF